MSGTATVERVVKREGLDALDLALLQRTLRPSNPIEHPSEFYWHFEIWVPQNGTKLIVGISWDRRFGKGSISLDRVTLDCPPLNQGAHQPHQRLSSIGWHGVDRIEYHVAEGYVDFYLPPASPEHNTRFLRVFSHGYFCGTAR